MDGKPVTYASIDAYILEFPPEVQEILQTLRTAIQKAAPEAKEKISYQMPIERRWRCCAQGIQRHGQRRGDYRYLGHELRCSIFHPGRRARSCRPCFPEDESPARKQVWLKDSRRLREEVLPRISDACYEDDMRYNAVVATHNELMAKFHALPVCVIEFEGGYFLIFCSHRLDTTAMRTLS